MKRHFLGFIFLILVNFGISAQTGDAGRPQILTNLSQRDGAGGQIEIDQSQQIESLLNMQIANNFLQKGIPGFRIQIFSQSGQTARQRADETRASFVRRFPEITVHQEYNAPNFQVFVGDFRTKNDALREMKRIERSFTRAFIVPTIIQIR